MIFQFDPHLILNFRQVGSRVNIDPGEVESPKGQRESEIGGNDICASLYKINYVVILYVVVRERA